MEKITYIVLIQVLNTC